MKAFHTAEKLDGIVRELCEINRRAGLERTLAIGQLILNEFFDGDVEAWKDRRRTKTHSIRRLAQRPGCPLAKSALNEAVAVYVSIATMPDVRTFGHVGASHVAAVLAAPEAERLDLLVSAEEGKWSVRRLRAELAAMYGDPAEEKQPRDVVARLVRQVRAATRGLESLISRPPSAAPDSMTDLVAALEALSATIEQSLAQRRAPVRLSSIRISTAGVTDSGYERAAI